ncbi:MAG: DUF1801 domain-containing protein [Bdellovibrionales bacterium]|nr:DUF1801 domain-containing protein [Bdellovibrionales bacterium]
MKKKPDSIKSFIASETPEIRKELKKLYAIIKKAAPKATEKLAWQMPTFHQEGNLIHFCSFTKHMSVFPGGDAMKLFKSQMKGYTTSKGTLQIPYGEKIPATLITKMVKYNLKYNLNRAKTKAAAKAAKKKKKNR